MEQNIQWYPGHMTKTKRMLITQIGLIDVVVELLDARVPLSSRNPDIDTLAKNKKRVLVLNKADLANPNITALWEKYFQDKGFFAMAVNAKNNDKKKGGTSKLAETLKIVMKEKSESQKKRGRINAPIRAMIVGIPNVGKSTFINQLSGRSSTLVADKPGVTRGRQWIKVGSDFDLLDTPGVLWPKFDDQIVGHRLAAIGAINDGVLDKITLGGYLLTMLSEIDANIITKRYNVELPGAITSQQESFDFLEKIGKVRGFIKKGGVIDIERTAIILLDEFRGGKLGRITLERP